MTPLCVFGVFGVCGIRVDVLGVDTAFGVDGVLESLGKIYFLAQNYLFPPLSFF